MSTPSDLINEHLGKLLDRRYELLSLLTAAQLDEWFDEGLTFRDLTLCEQTTTQGTRWWVERKDRVGV